MKVNFSKRLVVTFLVLSMVLTMSFTTVSFANPAEYVAPENIALGKTATVSIDSVSASQVGADKLTNGIKTNWRDRFASKQNPGADMVVTIDLGSVKEFSQVNIYQRSGTNGVNSENVKIEAGTTTDGTTTYTTVFENGKLNEKISDSGHEVVKTGFKFNKASGDKVKITLKNKPTVQYEICEIEVMSPEVGTKPLVTEVKNLVLNAKPLPSLDPQIVLGNDNYDLVKPENLTDGSKEWPNRFATVKGLELDLSVVFDLEGSYDISSVNVYHRYMNFKVASGVNIDIGVSSPTGAVTWTNVVTNGQLNDGTSAGQSIKTEFTFEKRVGDYIKIYFSENKIASGKGNDYQFEIFEIEVFGASEGYNVPSGGGEDDEEDFSAGELGNDEDLTTDLVSSDKIVNITSGLIPTANLDPINGNDVVGIKNLTDGEWVYPNRFAAHATKPLEVTINFDDIYAVSKLCVYERGKTYTTGETFRAELGLSVNGVVIWTEVINSSLSDPVADNSAIISQFNIQETNADRVKFYFDFDKASITGAQFEFYELEAFGWKNPKADYSKLLNSAKEATVDTNLDDTDISKLVDNNSLTSYKVDATSALELEIDLDKTQMVNYIEIFENFKKDNGVCADNIKIEVGNTINGVTLYKTLVDNASLNTKDTDATIKTLFAVENVYADKIKLTLAKEDSNYENGFDLADIRVLSSTTSIEGFLDAPKLQLKQGSSFIDINKLGTLDLSNIPSSEVVEVKAVFDYESDQSIDVLGVICAYDKDTNALKGMFVQDLVIGSENSATFELSLDKWENTYFVLSTLNSGSDFKPLCKKITVGE